MHASVEYTKSAATSLWRRSFVSRLFVPSAETSSGQWFILLVLILVNVDNALLHFWTKIFCALSLRVVDCYSERSWCILSELVRVEVTYAVAFYVAYIRQTLSYCSNWCSALAADVTVFQFFSNILCVFSDHFCYVCHSVNIVPHFISAELDVLLL